MLILLAVLAPIISLIVLRGGETVTDAKAMSLEGLSF